LSHGAYAETVTGTLNTVSPKGDTLPFWLLTPLANGLPFNSNASATPSYSIAVSLGFCNRSFMVKRISRPSPAKRFDTYHIYAYRVADKHSSAAPQSEREKSAHGDEKKAARSRAWKWEHDLAPRRVVVDVG
jgi:hypothetical protein